MYTNPRLMMTSTSRSRYRTIADANASGMRPSGMAVSSIHGSRSTPQRERDGVAQRERNAAEHRPRDDPAELAPRRDRSNPPQGDNHDGETTKDTGREVEVLQPPEGFKGPGQPRARRVLPHQDDNLSTTEQQRRQVQQREEPGTQLTAHPPGRPLGKREREMHEQRWEQQDRHFVGPVEHPIQTVQPTAVREGKDAEERHRQPEEVQCRLIARPAHSHRRANEEREEADRGQHTIDAFIPVRHRPQRQPT